MKSFILLIILLLLNIVHLRAQEYMDRSEEHIKPLHSIELGYGLLNFGKHWFTENHTFNNYVKNHNYRSIGSLFLKYEHTASKRIGIGINAAYFQQNESFEYTDEYYGYQVNTGAGRTSIEWISFSIMARLNIHFIKTSRFDMYSGVGLGVRSVSYSVSESPEGKYYNHWRTSYLKSSAAGELAFETTFGMRYFYTPNVGLYSEVGIAKAFFQLGWHVGF